jgi:hypothetical protein
MTPPANANHPYLLAEQFRDPTFIKVRRQVALLRLPYAEGKMRDLLEDTVRIYTDILARRTAE